MRKNIVFDAHEHLLHSGLNATVTYLRQQYWIPAIRQCVKQILHKCVPCKRVIGKPYQAPTVPTVTENKSPGSSTIYIHMSRLHRSNTNSGSRFVKQKSIYLSVRVCRNSSLAPRSSSESKFLFVYSSVQTFYQSKIFATNSNFEQFNHSHRWFGGNQKTEQFRRDNGLLKCTWQTMFWKRWKTEYLTSFREFHRTTGNND